MKPTGKSCVHAVSLYESPGSNGGLANRSLAFPFWSFLPFAPLPFWSVGVSAPFRCCLLFVLLFSCVCVRVALGLYVFPF